MHSNAPMTPTSSAAEYYSNHDQNIQLDNRNWPHSTTYSTEQGVHQSFSNNTKRLKSSSGCTTLSPAVSSVMIKTISCTGSTVISKPKRRRSRAKPKPPITRLAAQNKAHFKAIVHHFTSVGAPLDHSQLLLHNFPSTQLPTGSSSINPSQSSHHPAPSSAPNYSLGSSTITESLKSSLQMVFLCLQKLVQATSSQEAIIRQNAELEMYKSKTSVLLQELSKAAASTEVCTEESNPSASSGFSKDPATGPGPAFGITRGMNDAVGTQSLIAGNGTVMLAVATDNDKSRLRPENNTADAATRKYWSGPLQVSDNTQIELSTSSIRAYDLNIDDFDGTGAEPGLFASKLGEYADFNDILSHATMYWNHCMVDDAAGAASFLSRRTPTNANDCSVNCDVQAKELESFLLDGDISVSKDVDSTSFPRQTSLMQYIDHLLAPRG